jgi:putative endonuclease
MYHLYFLFSQQANKFYVGHSADPWKRLNQHLANSADKYTGGYHDWQLIAVFEVSELRGDADKIEKFIKRQKSRNLINKIIEPNFKGTGILTQLVRVPHVRSR